MTKDELKKIVHLDRSIRAHLAEMEKLKKWSYQLRAVAYDSMKVQTSDLSDPTARVATELVDRLQELSERVNREIDELVDLKRQAEEAIDRLAVPEHREVMRLRYLVGLDWQEVAERMNYSLQHVFRLHGKSLTKMCSFKRRVNESAGCGIIVS